METDFSTYYQGPKQDIWTGRITDPDLGNQYYHQVIEFVDATAFLKQPSQLSDIAFIGYACDEGVRRNQGRVGAKDGPNVIKQQLAKIALHHDQKIADFGTIICENEDLESTQQALAHLISETIEQNIFPIVLGGGHDIAYGHFLGIQAGLKEKYASRIGIINFDAHFDLRPPTQQANSGTPFYQILKENDIERVDYTVLGIQQAANTKELFSIADAYHVGYVLNHQCTDHHVGQLKTRLTSFIERNDYLYITIDLDGFSSAYAPGVSASSPMGFTPNFVLQMLDFILDSKKVISCDIAELNPNFDQDHVTAKLAARLINHIVSRR